MPDENQPNNIILRELSDIKSNLAVATNEVLNLKDSLTELKQNNNEFRSGYISRREFTDALQSLRKEIPDTSELTKEVKSLNSFYLKLVGALVLLGIIASYVVPHYF
jgi:hypothetical protein